MIVKYLTNRNILALLLLSIIPFSLCQMGLLLYATPVYLHELGISQSNIGRAMMIYGITVIYIAPYLSRFVDRSAHKQLYIAGGGLVGGLGLLLVAFMNGFFAILMAIFMMGVASSLAGSAQTVFAYSQPITKRVGPGTAVSVQRSADKLGQALGPLVLGTLFAVTSIENGISGVGGIYIIASLLFLVIARRN